MLASLRARIVSLPVAILCGLLSSSLVIRELGPQGFGIVSLIWSLALLLPFADLGIGAAIVNYISQSDNPSEDVVVRSVIVRSVRILTGCGLVLLFGATLIQVLDLWPVLLGVGALARNFSEPATLTVTIFALSLPLAIGQRVLLGLDRNELAVWLSALTPASALAFVALTLALSFDPIWCACAQATGLLVANLFTCVIAFRQLGLGLTSARNIFGYPPGQSCRPALIPTAGPMFVITVALPLALQSDRFVLAHRSSVYELAVYGLVAQLYAPIWTIISTTGQPLWPKFSQVRNNLLQVRELWKKSTLRLVTLAIVLSAGFLALGPAAADLISSSEIFAPLDLLALFALLLLVQTFQYPIGMYLTDEAGLRFQAICVTIMLVSNLVLSWFLTPSLGAGGPVVGSLVAIAMCQAVPGYAKFLKTSRISSVGGRSAAN